MVIGIVISIQESDIGFWESFKLTIGMGLVGMIGCGGFMVFPICAVLLSGGLKEYVRVMSDLKERHRVCAVCGCVAFYQGEYVYGNLKAGVERNTLIPTLHHLREAEDTYVLCSACLKSLPDQNCGEAK